MRILWFMGGLRDYIDQNREKFGTGKNSWYNLLFAATHLFFMSKYSERDEVLLAMKEIYDEENPTGNAIGFVLPSKKKQDDSLEFSLQKPENVEKMRPIRQKNEEINQQINILKSFLMFLYAIDSKSEAFEEENFPQLESAFEKLWEDQIALQAKSQKQKKKSDKVEEKKST